MRTAVSAIDKTGDVFERAGRPTAQHVDQGRKREIGLTGEGEVDERKPAVKLSPHRTLPAVASKNDGDLRVSLFDSSGERQ